MADMLLYVVIPYVATSLAIFGGIYRYFNDRFSFSSLSSQLLEHRFLFWGVVPLHYGIIPILLAHLLAIIFPGWWGFLLGGPDRLTAMELVGMALGMLSLVGMVILILRRLVDSKIRAVTSGMDWLLLTLLFLQVALGAYLAISYRWGSLWYLHTAVPWIHSLAILRPDPSSVVHLPVAAKLHMMNAVIIVFMAAPVFLDTRLC